MKYKIKRARKIMRNQIHSEKKIPKKIHPRKKTFENLPQEERERERCAMHAQHQDTYNRIYKQKRDGLTEIPEKHGVAIQKRKKAEKEKERAEREKAGKQGDGGGEKDGSKDGSKEGKNGDSGNANSGHANSKSLSPGRNTGDHNNANGDIIKSVGADKSSTALVPIDESPSGSPGPNSSPARPAANKVQAQQRSLPPKFRYFLAKNEANFDSFRLVKSIVSQGFWNFVRNVKINRKKKELKAHDDALLRLCHVCG
jgi:hypothetical protein